MRIFASLLFCCIITSAVGNFSHEDPRCHFEDYNKVNCGYLGITRTECETAGCCFFNEFVGNADTVTTCYHGHFEEEPPLPSPIGNINPIPTSSTAAPVTANPTTTTTPPPTTTPTIPTTTNATTSTTATAAAIDLFSPTLPPTTTNTTTTTSTTTSTSTPSTSATAPTLPTTTTNAATTTTTVSTSTIFTTRRPIVSLLSLIQMKNDNVSQDIINSLIADGFSNGDAVYALRDGKLDKSELLKLTGGHATSLNPVVAQYLAGNSMTNMAYQKIAAAYGVSPTVIQLLMTNNRDPIVKHLTAKLTAQENGNPLTSFLLSAATSGGISRENVKGYLINQAFRHKSVYSREAVKSIMQGDKQKALRWAFLASRKKRKPLSYYYPKHEIAFAYLVDSQKLFPKTIQPSVILALALNQSIPGIDGQTKTFHDMFGVKANNYVCSSHETSYRIPCKKLENRMYASALDCLDAGCCALTSTDPTKTFNCFENVLGKIGVGLATKLLDENYVINQVFGGNLPSISKFYPNGIPWLRIKTSVNASNFLNIDPSQPNFLDSMRFNGKLIPPFPTSLTIRPSKFRPNFVWKPHGPTSFPTLLPGGGYPMATDAPGVIFGAPYPPPSFPSIFAIPPLPSFSCRTVSKESRRACMDNSVVLSSRTQEAACKSMDCCFDPIWSNLSIPACFRSVEYGQCYNVPRTQRINCGDVGVTREKCLENPHCCFDSTINNITVNEPAPWCYYKLHTPIPQRKRCSFVELSKRLPCFPEQFNSFISQKTCEHVGCCFQKVKVSYFYLTLTSTKKPPVCFKLPATTLVPTDPPPVTTTIAAAVGSPTCGGSFNVNPLSRISCGAWGYYSCVYIKRCCFKREFLIPRAPWCFYKR